MLTSQEKLISVYDKKGEMDISQYIDTVVFLRLAFEVVKDALGYTELKKEEIFAYIEKNTNRVCVTQEGSIEESYLRGHEEYLPRPKELTTIKKLHYHCVLEVSCENTLRVYLGSKFVDRNGNKEGNLRWSLGKCRNIRSCIKYSLKGANAESAPTIVYLSGHLDSVALQAEWWEIDALIKSTKKNDKKRKSNNLLLECWEECTDTISSQVLAEDIYRFYEKRRIRFPVQSQFMQMIQTYMIWNNVRQDDPLTPRDMIRRMFPRIELA